MTTMTNNMIWLIALLLARAAVGVTPQECLACDFKRVEPASWTEGAAGAPAKPYLAGDVQFIGGVARKFEGAIKAVTSMIEPLMIVLMGSVVGFIAMAIILPIFKMSSLVTN